MREDRYGIDDVECVRTVGAGRPYRAIGICPGHGTVVQGLDRRGMDVVERRRLSGDKARLGGRVFGVGASPSELASSEHRIANPVS